jgi:hypothetical protein
MAADGYRRKEIIMKKLPIIGITLTLLLGLALWQQQLFVTKAAPVFNTVTVTNINDSGAGSLRQAIADAASGDTINFDTSGVFATPQTITLTSGELFINNKSLTIQGPGASQLTVSGNNTYRVFRLLFGNPVTLDGLTVSGGKPFNSIGGGILNDGGALTLINCTVSGNSSGIFSGGGIYNANGPLTLINCTVSGNSSGGGGGIFNGSSTMTLINCTITGNSTTFSGGGILNANVFPTLTLTNSTVSGNRSDSDGNTSGAGGGIYAFNNETLNNTIVAGNFRGTGTTPDDISGGTIDAANNNLIGDAATSGGITNGVSGNKVGFAVSAVLNTTLANNGGPTLTHALVTGSPAFNAGGNALAVDSANQPLTTDQRGTSFPRIIGGTVDIGSYELACASVVTNTADSGAGSLRQTIADACPNATITFDTAGVFATPQTITLTSGELAINNNLTIDGPGASQLTISGNNNFRAFFISAGNTVAIDGLTLTEGLGGAGGAISNAGSLTLTNSIVSNSHGVSSGGGIYNNGQLTIINSTISGNMATLNHGGGIENNGTLTVISSTISGNRGSISGGIDNTNTATLSNCTISGNRAVSAGAINNDINGTLIVTNTTITGNIDLNFTGGIFANGSETLNNTIVAGNLTGQDSNVHYNDIGFGTIDTANHNLIGDAATSGGITDGVNGNKVGNSGAGTLDINTVLNTTLANNGGPTMTHALVCDSPAIDAGSNALALDASSNPLTTDQRGTGFPRTLDGNGDTTALVDIGAFETVTFIPPTISVSDISLNEGNPGTTSFDFTVSLSQPAGACGVTFDIATQDNSATTANNDYLQKSLTGQTIPAGSSTYTFSVTVNGDLAFEPDETFFVNVGNVTGATLGDGQGLGTINNDDVAPVSITVNTSPAGLGITVDGNPYTSPQTFNWVPGSNHMIATTSPQSLVAGTQYLFLNWSDTGAISHTVTAPGSTTTYTANFKTQHQLTTSASAGGTVSPASGFYDQGNVVITATANAGFTFTGFSGALTGTTNPQTLNLTGPASVTANFVATSGCGITITINPATLPQPYLDVPYLRVLSATPAGNYSFSISAGQLPPGLHLVTAFGVSSIAGLPAAPGTYNFTIKAKKNNSTCEATRSYTVTIPPTIVPILNCVQRNQNNTYTARFGYDNSTGAAVAIPVGANNYFTPGNQNRGQTTLFQPGRVTNAFSVTFTKGRNSNLAIWLLKGPDGVLRPVNVLTTSIGCP